MGHQSAMLWTTDLQRPSISGPLKALIATVLWYCNWRPTK